MAEFAALFGKEKSWSYRQKYKGNIDVITDFGVEMVAASQVKRIEDSGGRYLGKKKPARAPAKPAKLPGPGAKGGEDVGKVLRAIKSGVQNSKSSKASNSPALKRMGRRPPPH